MGTTSDLQKGLTIRREGKLWFVVSSFFVSPRQGGGFLQDQAQRSADGQGGGQDL